MNDVVVHKSFEEKMKDRIKESIGDLMTNEDLAKIVERSMEEIFFKERIVKSSGYYSDVKTIPPLAHEIVKNLLEPKVKEVIQEYLEKENQMLTQHIKERLDAGLSKLIFTSVDSYLNSKFSIISNNIALDINCLFDQHNSQKHGS